MREDKITRQGLLLLLALLPGFLVACSDQGSGDTPAGATSDRIMVVATTTMLGDVAREIVGQRGTVEVLFPVGSDPHEYRPSSQQVARLQAADLVVVNGLGLEDALLDVLDNAGSDVANVLEVAGLVDPLPFGRSAARQGDGGVGHDDPHIWMDPLRMAEVGRIIAAELAGLDGNTDWVARGEAYATRLIAADAQIIALLSAVPSDGRTIVSNHDSLGYFADRYGFEIIGTVIPGGATLSQPSSAELASLVTTIEREGVPAIFTATTESSVLAEIVAAEVGETVAVVELYTGSLGGPGSGAATLIEMLVTNARRIATALS